MVNDRDIISGSSSFRFEINDIIEDKRIRIGYLQSEDCIYAEFSEEFLLLSQDLRTESSFGNIE